MSRLLIALLGALSLWGCASSAGLDGNSSAVTVASELPTPTAADMGIQLSEYRLGPTDKIAITVFEAPELTREGQLDSAGNILMPLIGTVEAGGRTPAEVAALVTDKLKGRYIKEPQVAVNVLEARAHTVTVDGAVTQPGIYPVSGQMTLQRAIALARGLNDVADTDKVVIFRSVQGTQMAAMFDLGAIRSGRITDPAIYGNDIVVVGESGTRRFLKDVGKVPILGQFMPLL